MDAGRTGFRSPERPRHEELVLELERFVWAAPDRLEVAGKFVGLSHLPLDEPILVVRGRDRTHRLPAARDDQSPVPVDGVSWRATFSWQEAPVAFDLAELHLSPDLVIELPEPHAEAPAGLQRVLPARPSVDDPADDAEDEGWLEPELETMREELSDLRAVVRRTQKELEAARAELEGSRRRSAADAERFRTGLAAIRATAEDALALEQEVAEEIRARLSEAHERVAAHEAEVDRLHKAFDQADDVRRRAAEDARAEIDGLRAELETHRQNADRLHAQAAQAEAVASQVRAERDALRVHVNHVREVLGDAG